MTKTNKQQTADSKSRVNEIPSVVEGQQPNSDDLLKEIATLKQLVEQYKNQALRALADYQNQERRIHTERQMVIEQANLHLLKDLVSMKEDMDKAEAFDKNPGLVLVIQKMSALFKRFGVEEFKVLGTEFSPDTMECINVVKGDKDNFVSEVHEKGYMLHGKLLRPARVTVSKLQVDQQSG